MRSEELKEQIDKYISTESVFTEKDRAQVYQQIQRNKKPSKKIRLLPAFTILLLISFGAISFSLMNHESPRVTMEEKKEPPVFKEEFTLSNEENNAYQSFLKDLNEVHLKDLSPISIAKLYVKAEIDQQYDAVYALYTDRKEHIQWTKEEDRAIPKEDRGTKKTLIKKFKNIGKGTFIQTSEDQGYISFQGPDGKLGFQMIKDDDGIWNVAFQPIQ
ncbi:hypothetical protein M3589_17360 [Heyndrickxia oleronia]|uniref:hypothetical protein n=1 Tax=Heyndrickxia oleronia TaxID=38875 RepID=UPI00203FF0BF|nr:hypothetical protein [Heyndrickxia oleronia]MCM3239470.1 hypothetical protein [Heyndrickxia oleronia]